MDEETCDSVVTAVKQAGVVGAGGAGFPTSVKINATVNVVIANGAECEPLLRANQQLMLLASDKVVAGLVAVMAATRAQQGYIALKKKHTEAIKALEHSIAQLKRSDIHLAYLPDFYPAGDEQILVYEVTRKIVPEGGIPLNVGAVVSNIETLVNVAEAVQGKPVTEKYVTVTGAVAHPMTVKAPLGIAVRELIEIAGGATVTDYAVIDGGPMMGKLIEVAASVTKTTGGIILLPRDHPVVVQKTLSWQTAANRAKAVCCNCRACTECCPRHLIGHSIEPHRVMQAVGGGLNDTTAFTRAFLCSECGACDTFGCTMGLSPRRINAELKRQMGKAGVRNPHRQQPPSVRSNREYRRIPTKRLLYRLGLESYDVAAPLSSPDIAPQEVRLSLAQHIGAAAQPVVKVGDRVNKGDMIAVIPEGAAVGAVLHASLSGEVYEVTDFIGIIQNQVRGGNKA